MPLIIELLIAMGPLPGSHHAEQDSSGGAIFEPSTGDTWPNRMVGAGMRHAAATGKEPTVDLHLFVLEVLAGLCSVVDGRCRAVEDDDCKRSLVCRVEGKCRAVWAGCFR
jgi:hypothetical protein